MSVFASTTVPNVFTSSSLLPLAPRLPPRKEDLEVFRVHGVLYRANYEMRHFKLIVQFSYVLGAGVNESCCIVEIVVLLFSQV